ncbi:hypothetical protein BC835DRAFT_397203 [Cytidiella melzeri]|nr:hypothetical protein BC835DRAFT_397203 [Cytidiella melzeri]
MQTLTLEVRGLVYAYEDSGAPASSSSYTTVLMVHPPWFHGRIFCRMFPCAEAQGIRFIAIHSRGYCGSSPYTEDELDRRRSGPEEQETVIYADAVDFAMIMAQLIRQEGLPPHSEVEDVKTGGICIFSWSAGCTPIISLLANITSLDESLSALLERYLCTVILFDCPSMCYGIPEPTKTFHPFRDPTLTNEQKEARMYNFIVTYYDPFEDLASVTPTSIEQRKTLASVSPTSRPTVTEFSPQEAAEVSSPEVARHIGHDLLEWQVYAENVRRALLDTQGAWKNVKVVVAWADMSVWSVAWGAKCLQEILDSPADEEVQRRDVRVSCMKGANHFAMFDCPEQTVCFLVAHMH